MKVNTQLASLTIILSLAQENDNTDTAKEVRSDEIKIHLSYDRVMYKVQ